jgi:hypothetical protein
MPLLWFSTGQEMTTDKRVPVTFHSAALLLAIDLIGTFVFAVRRDGCGTKQP